MVSVRTKVAIEVFCRADITGTLVQYRGVGAFAKVQFDVTLSPTKKHRS